MTDREEPSLRVIAAAVCGGALAVGLWIASSLAFGGMSNWALPLLGVLPGLGARFAGARDLRSGRFAAAVALMALFVGKAQALELLIAREREKLAPPPSLYDYRARTAALWIEERGAPLGEPAADEVVLEFYANNAPRVWNVSESQVSDADYPYVALSELEKFYLNPPTRKAWNAARRIEELPYFDRQFAFWHLWRRNHSPAVLLVIVLGAWGSSRVVRGRGERGGRS